MKKTKKCPRCLKRKLVSQFNKCKTRGDGLSYYCKSCCQIQKKAFYLRHSEKVRSRVKSYQQAHPEKHQTRMRIRREKNPGIDKEAIRQWRKENPGRVRALRAKRRYSQRRAMPSWILIEYFEAIYLESQRLTRETGILHHVDHIIPIQHPLVCGLHVPWNLQILTQAENCSKRNKFQIGDEE